MMMPLLAKLSVIEVWFRGLALIICKVGHLVDAWQLFKGHY